MLKLKADPVFHATVAIPAPGGKDVKVGFEFKHMTRKALDEFLTSPEAKTRTDEDTILAIASGWRDVDAEFSRESLAEMFENYHAAPRAIVEAYLTQLTQVRLGN